MAIWDHTLDAGHYKMAIWDQLKRIPAAYEGLDEKQATALDAYAMDHFNTNTYQNAQNVMNAAMNMPPEMFSSAQSQQMLAQQLAAQQWQAPAKVPVHEHARSMLMDRLNGITKVDAFIMHVDDFLFTHVHKDKVYVFFIHDERAGHLEDDVNLFPSDRLITQVRLLWS